MRETSKCYEWRVANGEFDKYLHGHGIDIGAGNDVLRLPASAGGSVRPWDVQDGDAQTMIGVADSSYDFVYSSHCLEHMRDIHESLRNWVRILKPGGFLYVVVPDYLYYEKGCWPSMFNSDHKHSFSMEVSRDQVRRANHWHLRSDLVPLIESLGATVVRTYLQLQHLDWNQTMRLDHTMTDGVTHLVVVAEKRLRAAEVKS
jgi:ubiquinone/menaquinone biosynthesis C-methylase UbiE